MQTMTVKSGPQIYHRNRSPEHLINISTSALARRARRLQHGCVAGIWLMTAVWLLLAGATLPVWAGATNSPAGTANSAGKPYPIDYCLICGDKVVGTNPVVVINYQGQELRFCCKHCVKTFKQDPAKYLKKLHDAGNPGAVSKDASGGEITGHQQPPNRS
jgi:YHS domain-containing protein